MVPARHRRDGFDVKRDLIITSGQMKIIVWNLSRKNQVSCFFLFSLFERFEFIFFFMIFCPGACMQQHRAKFLLLHRISKTIRKRFTMCHKLIRQNCDCYDSLKQKNSSSKHHSSNIVAAIACIFTFFIVQALAAIFFLYIFEKIVLKRENRKIQK